MMECKYCGASCRPWWPSARTGAHVCKNKDCTDPEYRFGNGRELQYPDGDGGVI
jgi:hypothetical protein